MKNYKLDKLFVLDKANTNAKDIATLKCGITYLEKRKI